MRTDARRVGRWLSWALIASPMLASGCTIPGPYSLLKKVISSVPPEVPYEAIETPEKPLPPTKLTCFLESQLGESEADKSLWRTSRVRSIRSAAA